MDATLIVTQTYTLKLDPLTGKYTLALTDMTIVLGDPPQPPATRKPRVPQTP